MAALLIFLAQVFWRRSPPRRDWLHTEGFDLRTAQYGNPGTHTDDHVGEVDVIGSFGVRTPSSMARHVAQKMYWLCGLPPPRMLGGQAWPGNPHYGFEQAEGGGNPANKFYGYWPVYNDAAFLPHS